MKMISTGLRERISARSRRAYATVAAVLLAGTAATLATTASASTASAATAKPAVPAANQCLHRWTFQSVGPNDTTPAGYLNVDHAGGSGAAVITWYSAPNAANEIWCMEQVSSGVWYFHPSYDLSLCMDVPNSSFVAGTKLWVFSCNGSKAQRFSFGSGDTLILTEGKLTLGLKDNGYGNAVSLAASPNRTYWR